MAIVAVVAGVAIVVVVGVVVTVLLLALVLGVAMVLLLVFAPVNAPWFVVVPTFAEVSEPCGVAIAPVPGIGVSTIVHD